MVQAAEGARGVGLGTSGIDVAILVAVVALGESIGGDDRSDASGVGEEANGLAYRGHVMWFDGNGD